MAYRVILHPTAAIWWTDILVRHSMVDAIFSYTFAPHLIHRSSRFNSLFTASILPISLAEERANRASGVVSAFLSDGCCAVAAVLFKPGANGWCVLIVRRSHHSVPSSGYSVRAPGGGVCHSLRFSILRFLPLPVCRCTFHLPTIPAHTVCHPVALLLLFCSFSLRSLPGRRPGAHNYVRCYAPRLDSLICGWIMGSTARWRQPPAPLKAYAQHPALKRCNRTRFNVVQFCSRTAFCMSSRVCRRCSHYFLRNITGSLRRALRCVSRTDSFFSPRRLVFPPLDEPVVGTVLPSPLYDCSTGLFG